MNSVDSFVEGDLVIFAVDKDDIDNAKKYCVIEKTDNKIIIRHRLDKPEEVNPFELLTPQQILQEEKEAEKRLNSML
jgi:hypothetical protein